VGLRSVPMISAVGYSSPTSIAHMPVPVPMSRMLPGLGPRGARKSLPPIVRRSIPWVRSSRSSSLYRVVSAKTAFIGKRSSYIVVGRKVGCGV